MQAKKVYKDLIISTIVDNKQGMMQAGIVYKDLIISTIVDGLAGARIGIRSIRT